MDESGAIREMIRAVAEGASGGAEEMRAAGMPVTLQDFSVEVSVGPGDGATEASIVVHLAASGGFDRSEGRQ